MKFIAFTKCQDWEYSGESDTTLPPKVHKTGRFTTNLFLLVVGSVVLYILSSFPLYLLLSVFETIYAFWLDLMLGNYISLLLPSNYLFFNTSSFHTSFYSLTYSQFHFAYSPGLYLRELLVFNLPSGAASSIFYTWHDTPPGNAPLSWLLPWPQLSVIIYLFLWLTLFCLSPNYYIILIFFI